MRIKQTASKYIMFGIMNKKRMKDRSSYSSGEGSVYNSTNGYKYPEGVQQGNGFAVNEIISLKVFLK